VLAAFVIEGRDWDVTQQAHCTAASAAAAAAATSSYSNNLHAVITAAAAAVCFAVVCNLEL
jgi:hypothetical protein